MSYPKNKRDHSWFARQLKRRPAFLAKGLPQLAKAAISNGSHVSYVSKPGIRLFAFEDEDLRDSFVKRHRLGGAEALSSLEEAREKDYI